MPFASDLSYFCIIVVRFLITPNRCANLCAETEMSAPEANKKLLEEIEKKGGAAHKPIAEKVCMVSFTPQGFVLLCSNVVDRFSRLDLAL